MCCKKTYTIKSDEMKQTYVALSVPILDHIMWQAYTNTLEQNHKLYDTIKNLNTMENKTNV